jgi:hypothetical protein
MKIAKRSVTLFLVLTMMLAMSATVWGADVLRQASGTIFDGRYTTGAMLTWNQPTGTLSATTSCSGAGAGYSTAVMCTFTYNGVVAEGPVINSGTTIATLSRPGYGFVGAVSDHTVRYGNDQWSTRLTY